MRIWIGRLLLLLGAFALVAAGVGAFWGNNAARRIPLDTDTKSYLTGSASGVLAHSKKPVQVRYLNETTADADRSTDDALAVVQTTCIVVDRGNPPDCPSAKQDPRVVRTTAEAFAVDRSTGAAVGDQSEYVPGSSTDYDGQMLKMPFDAEKKDYEYWNGTLGKAVPLTYQGEREIDGLQTYEYTLNVPLTKNVVVSAGTRGQADVRGTYQTTQTIWADPETGAFIDQTGSQRVTTDDGTVLLDIDVSYTDDTVSSNVATAEDNIKMLGLVGFWLPVVGGIVGVVLIVIGLWLCLSWRSARRRQTAFTDEASVRADAEI